MRPRMINGVAFNWGGFTPANRPEFSDSFVRVNSATMGGKNRMQFHSLKCYRCDGRVEAVVYDDVLTMLIDGAQHQVPVKHVPAYRCLDCQTSWTDGCADETIHYWWLQYVKANGLYTPWRRFCRWCRKYRDSWYYWHWNRAPWARWTWGDTPVPDRVLKRRWWQWR
jgi:hypothetical protein